MRDPYEVLGLARDADEAAIKAAYRKLAKRHHPDLHPGDAKAAERFSELNNANDILSDPERRGRFDRGEIDAEGRDVPPQGFYRDFRAGPGGGRYYGGGEQHGAAGDAGFSEDDIASFFASIRDLYDAGRRHAVTFCLLGITLSCALEVWPTLQEAVVVGHSVQVRVSPTLIEEPLFVLPEADIVSVSAEHDGFMLVKNSAGRTGWAPNANLALIVAVSKTP